MLPPGRAIVTARPVTTGSSTLVATTGTERVASLFRHRRGGKCGDQHIGLEPAAIPSPAPRQAIELALGRPDVENDVLTLDVPELAQLLAEWIENRLLQA